MKRTLFFLLILIGLPAAAQNSGLFGKTTFVEVTGIGNFNPVSNLFAFETYYKKDGNKLKEGRDFFSGGVYIAAGKALKRNVALTLETGWWSFNVAGPTSVRYETPNYNSELGVTHEAIDALTFTIMPIVEIGGRGGLLPIGISHQIGVGYTSSRLIDKDYLVKPYSTDPITYYDDMGNYHTIDPQYLLDSLYTARGGFADYKNKYSGVTLLYGLKVRTPITKNLLINYGLRYTLNIGSRSASGDANDPESWSQDVMRRRRFNSLIGVNLGLTYLF